MDPTEPLGDDNYSDAEDDLVESDPETYDEQPIGTFSTEESAIASENFLELQRQMFSLFENTQSQAVELRQRVDELEEGNLEAFREEENAYEVWEAELLSRIENLDHEVEKLSDELVAKNNSTHKLLQENARLIAKMDAMETAHAVELSAFAKKMVKDSSHRYRAQIASLKDDLLVATQGIEDHATTKTLRAQNAELQQSLETLQEYNTILENKKAVPPRKKKKPAKNAPASDNLRKLYVADLNHEIGRKLEEQDRIAKSQAASMEQTVIQLRQRVAELEQSHSTIEKGYDGGTNHATELESALVEIARLQGVVEEQSYIVEEQESIIENYRELEHQYLLIESSDSLLPEDDMTLANEVVKTSAAPSSATDKCLQEEASVPASGDQLELPAEVSDEPERPKLVEELLPAEDAMPESKVHILRQKNAGLEEEVEILRRRNQNLQEKNELFHEQNKKWGKLFATFVPRAAHIQRRDSSRYQVRKGFKVLNKIVKEGEVQDF